MKINYKSDFEFDYTLLDEHGQATTPPDFPWKLVLSVGNPLKPYVGQCGCANGRNFVAEYDGENYHNCVVQNDVIRVFVDNHGLPCGQLWATFITYTPNPDFPDGNRRVYTPQATDTFLVAEAGDDPTPAQIQYTANYVVFEHEYTAGQGITIENDVISATGESYTAGEGITIADGEIGLSQGTLDELESHDADIRDLITSVNSLERGNDRAVRLTDTTTTGEAGKVVKVDETVVGTTYSRITADIFESKMVESDGGICYAFPSSSNEVKTNADDMLLASGDKAELEQQINGKASTSSVNAIDGRVTTLENTYEDTMNIANNQLNELIDGKAMIASALTDRGYPTAPTDSSASMAQKIENMAYDAGWLAQLGYTETNDGGVKDAVAYSKAIKDGWNPAETTRRFTNDTQLVFFPQVDTSQFTNLNNMFGGCSRLVGVPNLDLRNVTSVQNLFGGNSIAEYHDELDLSKCPSLSGMFGDNNLVKFVEITIGEYTTSIANLFWQSLTSLKTVIIHGGDNVTNANNAFGSRALVKVDGLNFKSTTSGITNSLMFSAANNTLVYLKILNIGTPSSATSYTAMSTLPYWGNTTEENRQSLVDTFLTYSFDRATAGYSACTVKLHADTLARLTAEEIAAITAKGFTLTS